MIEHSRDMLPCTVAILTKNSGGTLARALESVKNFKEIIVCDGGSTDETLAIARAHGACIIAQNAAFLDANGRIMDYAGVRNQTLEAASYEWFFFLDSDEWCSGELLEEIRAIVTSRHEGAFFVPRLYVMEGEVIRCASTYPNFQMRFFAKRSVRTFIKQVHERIELLPETVPQKVSGALLIPLEQNAQELRAKWRRYIALHVEREGSITLRKYLKMCFQNAAVSGLLLFRLCRNILFCSGPHMPLSIEMSRHWYHLRMLRAFAPHIRGF